MQNKPIGEQLKAWRAVRGLSQRDLAERAGVVYPLVARLELGQTDPRLSTLHRLAEALGIDVVDLLRGPEKPKRSAQTRARGN